MLTVIWSEMAAVSNAAACCTPARKLAGAAIAAASNNRLMVIPPSVMATIEVGPLWALWASAASLVRAGLSGISTGAPDDFLSSLVAEKLSSLAVENLA